MSKCFVVWQILSNIWAVHNDSDVWDEPEKFKPERFLDENGDFIQSKDIIPFSIGPRYCLGEKLARMEIFLFLVSIVQKFEILPPTDDGILPHFEDGANGLAFTPETYCMVAKQI